MILRQEGSCEFLIAQYKLILIYKSRPDETNHKCLDQDKLCFEYI